jgi:non-specific serine/threonine protein kinase
MASPNNLPQQLTSFVGREREVSQLQQLIASLRLVTLTGMGGSGKTRLALEVASCLLDEYPDGVWLIDLSALTDPALVAQSVASTLGVREEPNTDPLAGLVKHLQPLQTLLVLDNCEHLLAACSSLADTLLRACGRLDILATSRQALGVAGELAWPMPALSVPEPRQQLTLDSLAKYEAVRLFVERARMKRQDFRVTEENVQAIAQLCYRLDGIPLAIELAAARMKLLSVQQIVERLDARFRLLVSSDQALPLRQQTLQALIDWSYDLLSDGERRLLRSLSVFAGGFSLEAVEALWEGSGPDADVLDILSQLVDKSLVLMDEQDGRARYRMLETIRQYAAERLDHTGEAEEVRQSHARFFVHMAEDAEPHLRGPDQAKWRAQLDKELDNLRAALTWASEGSPDEPGSRIEVGLRIASALYLFWQTHNYLGEGRAWLESLLARPESEMVDGVDKTVLARAFSRAGFTTTLYSEHAKARLYNERSLALYRQLGDKLGIAAALNGLGNAAMDLPDYEAAKSYYEESLAIRREQGNTEAVALSLNNLGLVAARTGDYDEAVRLGGEALHIMRGLGNQRQASWLLRNLGWAKMWRGDYDEAEPMFIESLQAFNELGMTNQLAGCLQGLAVIALRRGRPRKATLLLGAALGTNETYLNGLDPGKRRDYERTLHDLRSALGDSLFHTLFEQGKTLPWEEALTYEEQGTTPSSAQASPPELHATVTQAGPNSLSERELEVLRLVAQGKSNPQIANELFLSVNTVQVHLRRIYAKLGVASRTEATRYAFEHNLV